MYRRNATLLACRGAVRNSIKASSLRTEGSADAEPASSETFKAQSRSGAVYPDCSGSREVLCSESCQGDQLKRLMFFFIVQPLSSRYREWHLNMPQLSASEFLVTSVYRTSFLTKSVQKKSNTPGVSSRCVRFAPNFNMFSVLMFLWPCIMNWPYKIPTWCTDYYLFIKYYSPLHVSSIKYSSSGGYSCMWAAYGTVTLYKSPSVLLIRSYRENWGLYRVYRLYRKWRCHMLLTYNCILLKMSTWYSKHVEENIWRINNIKCITLIFLVRSIHDARSEKH